MGAIKSQITSLTIVYSTVYSDAHQRKHQSSASLAFVRGIHRWPVNSPHKGPVTWKIFPFDDFIMVLWPCILTVISQRWSRQRHVHPQHQSIYPTKEDSSSSAPPMDAEKKWLPICRQHFKSYLPVCKMLYFVSNVCENCFQVSIEQQTSTGSDNGLATSHSQTQW